MIELKERNRKIKRSEIILDGMRRVMESNAWKADYIILALKYVNAWDGDIIITV